MFFSTPLPPTPSSPNQQPSPNGKVKSVLWRMTKQPLMTVSLGGLLLLVGVFLLANIRTSDSNARQFVKDQGFTNIHQQNKELLFTDRRVCQRSAAAEYTFTAVNGGRKVTLHVCENWYGQPSINYATGMTYR